MDTIFSTETTDRKRSKGASTPDAFLDLVRRSQLVPDEELEAAVKGFENKASSATAQTAALAYHLISKNLLTGWQSKMLLQGRWRGFVLGTYKLLDQIGSGGMSRVFLGEHLVMKRRVAIKVLPPMRGDSDSRLRRFLAESRMIGQMDHPNIVRAFHFDKQHEHYYLVMEFIDGQNLRQMVEFKGPAPFRDAADYIKQACHGLAHAHSFDLIHRDIKPANLLVDRHGIVKILDLGLARSLAGGETSLTQSHNNKLVGTVDYVAPEQVKDSHNVDPRTDIYSLGCTFYYVLTGSAPFPEGGLAEKLAMHLYHQPESIANRRPDTPEPLIEVCYKMMAKRPADRFQTAAEVRDVLEQWLAGKAMPSFPPVPLPERPDAETSDTHHEEKSPTLNLPDKSVLADANGAATTSGQDAPQETQVPPPLVDNVLADQAEPPAAKAKPADTPSTPKRRKVKKKRRRRKRKSWPEVMTLEEVTKYLRISADSLTTLIEQGRIPCQQIGDDFRFHKSAVDRWLQETNFSSNTWQTLLPAGGVSQLGGLKEDIARAKSVTVRKFLHAAGSAEILASAELNRLHEEWQPRLDENAESMARELVTQGLLTDYQAAILIQGSTEGLRYGDYVVLEKLGSGGMAVVLKARHRESGKVVALKVLFGSADPREEYRRFDREVRAVAKLNHPNIVVAYDAVHSDDVNYLVMEYVDGPNLDQFVRRRGKLSVETAVDYILQVAYGLEHAHEQHMIHRDIKPGNLLLDSSGVVKVLDLGLVRFDHLSFGESGTNLDTLTRSESLLGTPEYMAPEQFTDARKAGGQADIYSLGCTLFYLLTGKSPYARSTANETLKAHQTEPPPLFAEYRADVPARLQAVFGKMIEKELSRRYQSMSDLIADLEQFRENPFGPPDIAADSTESTLSLDYSPVAGTEDPSLNERAATRQIGRNLAIGAIGGLTVGMLASLLLWQTQLVAQTVPLVLITVLAALLGGIIGGLGSDD